MSAKWNTSVIVCTYNSSDRLGCTIASLEAQSVLPEEVVIADDGSSEEHVRVTEEIIEKSPLKMVYAWQEDKGYRAAANRNNGVRHASGDYLLFIDGDAAVPPNCLETHLAHSDERHWLAGDAIWLTEAESRAAIEEAASTGKLTESWPGPDDVRWRGTRGRARRFTVRALRQWLWRSERRMRRLHPRALQFSLPRAAFEKVNGFDENYEGYGKEDQDLTLRLQLAGFRGRAVGHLCPGFHLHHGRAQEGSTNREYFARPRHGEFWCEKGLVREIGDGAGV